MDGTATINAKVDSLRLCGIVQNLACAKPRLLGYRPSRFSRTGCAPGPVYEKKYNLPAYAIDSPRDALKTRAARPPRRGSRSSARRAAARQTS